MGGRRRAHLLVVDDDTLRTRLVENRLRADGYRVSTASDGNVALYILAAGGVDMVVTDGLALPQTMHDKFATPIIQVSGDRADHLGHAARVSGEVATRLAVTARAS